MIKWGRDKDTDMENAK